MAEPKVTLQVSELYAWKKRRGRMAKRIYPSQRARARRVDAQCMALLKSGNRPQLAQAAEALKLLPLVRSAEVTTMNDCFELVVHSKVGLVTKEEWLDFVRQVRGRLATGLQAEVEVKKFNLR
jgi:hypothetical protein